MLSPSHEVKTIALAPAQSKEGNRKRNAKKGKGLLEAPAIQRGFAPHTPAQSLLDAAAASCRKTKLKSKTSDAQASDSDEAKVLSFETPVAKSSSSKRVKTNAPVSECKSDSGKKRDSPTVATRDESLTPCASLSSTDVELFSDLLEVFANDDDEAEIPELYGFSLAISRADGSPELDDEIYMSAHGRLENSFSSLLEQEEPSFLQDTERTALVCQQICVCMALGRCTRKVAHEAKKAKTAAITGDLTGTALEILGKIVKAASQSIPEADNKRRGSRKAKSGAGFFAARMCECLKSVTEAVKRMAESDEHLVTVMRIALDGVMSEAENVQKLSVLLLKALASRSIDHRRSVIEEVFLTVDDERLQPSDRVRKTIPIEGTDKKLRPISLVLLHLFQGVNEPPSTDQHSGHEMLVRGLACYLIRMFERRFFRDELKSSSERAMLQQKDMDGKAWMEAWMEDVFAVLFLPQFPVAELLLTTIVDKLQSMLRLDASDKLHERHRGVVIDLLASILSRVAAVRRRVLEEANSMSEPVSPDDAEEAHDEIQAKGLVLRGLASNRDEVFQDALVFLRALWCWTENDSGGKKGKRQAPSPPSPEELQRGCFCLARHGSLLARLPARVNTAFLLHLVREGKYGGERSRILRAATELFSVDPLIVHPAFLKVVRQQYLFDHSAGVRSAAVELLGKVVLSNIREQPGQEVNDEFETLAARSFDTSMNVRARVLAVLREICETERDSVDISAGGEKVLVGMPVTKNALNGWMNGRIVAYDSKMVLFKVEFSNGDVERMPLESVCESLVVGARPDDAATFPVRTRFVAAASKAAAMLLYSIRGQEEDGNMERCVSLFTSLWFRQDCAVPCNVRLQEIETVVQSSDSAQWLECVLKHALAAKDAHTAEVLSCFVNHLFSKITAIHNAGAFSPSQRPAAFNDFQTRASLLLPPLQAMVPLARAAPHLFSGRLREFAPMLLELELCKDQSQVIRSLLDVLDAVVGSGGQLAKDVEEMILRAFLSGAFKLADPKRFGKTDEIARAVKCFCTVVKRNRSPAAERALLGTLMQCLQFLKSYIDHPAEEHLPWVPRSLVLAGAIVRYCGVSSLSQQGAELTSNTREQLFLMTLTHYSNHLLEQVKKASLYVVGAVLIHEPKKALQKSCMKLLVRSLSAEASPSLQCQVLRNLHDQFQVEDERMAASASLNGPDPDQEHDGNTSTSVMHKFHDLILSSSLSVNVNVRFDAVSLILLILRRGMTATYLAIPYLIAQQALADGPSLLAMRALDSIREKETTHYQAHVFWDGIVKSATFCHSEADLAKTAFAAAFRHLASVGKDGNRAVRHLLQCAASKFDKFSSVPTSVSDLTSFDFKLYAASIVARLPFNTLDGPLFFIHHIHKIVTVLAGGCLEGLGGFIADELRVVDVEAVERWRQEGACIALLLSVQDYLQSEYGIKMDRIKKFLAHPDVVDKTAKTRSEDGATFSPVCLFQGQWGTGRDKASLQEDHARLRSLLHSDLFADSLVLSDAPSPSKPIQDGEAGTTAEVARAPGRANRSKKRKAQSMPSSPASSEESAPEHVEDAADEPPSRRRGKKQAKDRKLIEPSPTPRASKEGKERAPKKRRKARRL